MRRIVLALLICLLPLQSFASAVMSAKMASMDMTGNTMSQMQMADSAQAACHEASQTQQLASQDCCGLQGLCQLICHVVAVPPTAVASATFSAPIHPTVALATSFQSADLSAGFKPPLL
jgi:hypothetical protein